MGLLKPRYIHKGKGRNIFGLNDGQDFGIKIFMGVDIGPNSDVVTYLISDVLKLYFGDKSML